MSDLTKMSDAGLEGLSMLKLHPLTRQAGVALAALDAVYIDANGLLQKAVTTVASPVTGTFMRTAFDGVPAVAIPSGSFGEIYGRGAYLDYAASGLTIGSPVWASNTAGKLADAKVAAQDEPIGIVRSATQIELLRGV